MKNVISKTSDYDYYGCIYFWSYSRIVCSTNRKGEVTLDRGMWLHTVTHGYGNEFLKESVEETQAKLDSGEYKLADLN